jgi:hypothetical protein
VKKDKSITSRFDAEKGLDRRTVMKGAAWSVPVIALAVATPAHAASIIDVGAYRLDGDCGILAVIGPGFTLQASATAPLPVGTTVTITSSGIASIGVVSIDGGTASVNVLSPTSQTFTLTAPLPAGATIAFRTLLSINVAFTLNAVSTLPGTYEGSGAKSAGSVSSTLILCTDS